VMPAASKAGSSTTGISETVVTTLNRSGRS
jgi:hypothetical protein